MLRPTKGNMYGFITHTWNPIKGECPHGCTYCYMKRWGAQKPLHLDEREMRTDLGSGNYIFVGSSTDMWAEAVPLTWIKQVLHKCYTANGNKYLMQTKNPLRVEQYARNSFLWTWQFMDFVFCTTLETNRDTKSISPNAPSTEKRAQAMNVLHKNGLHTMVTIEPIMDFDLEPFTDMIMQCNPCQVNIGADSGRHGLPEPSMEKVKALIFALRDKGIKVVQKKNLLKITGEVF